MIQEGKIISNHSQSKKFVQEEHHLFLMHYRKVPKFSDARKHCCNLPKFQTNRPNLKVFQRQNDVNGIAKSEDPDQSAPLGAV